MYEEPYDYGFDLPDIRYRFIALDGLEVTVRIIRHWFLDEDGDSDWYPTFQIRHGNDIIDLPRMVNEWKASEIAELMFGIDEEETELVREMEADMAFERAAGC